MLFTTHSYSRHTFPHFVHLKNLVGGSSAALICCIHQYASRFSHFGQGAVVLGKTSMFDFLSSIIILFFLFSEKTLILNFFSFDALFLPHCLHMRTTRAPDFFGIINPPHFSQNSTASPNFLLNNFLVKNI